jgi:Tfp pilus assembly protein PilN
MIKINLLKRKKPGGGGKSQKIFGIEIGKGIELDGLKDFNWKTSPFPRMIIAGILVYASDLQVASMKQEKLTEQDGMIAAVEAEQAEIVKKLAKVKGFEPLKKQLEDDERNIQAKLDIINQLLENRDAPPRLLRQLSGILPAEVWLQSLTVNDGRLSIEGGATSYSLVSDFMKGVSDSSMFSAVTLGQVNETQGSEGLKYQSFSITAGTKGI